MSSATLTKRSFRAEATGPEAAGPQPAGAEVADEGFRPWHFFVLASLAAATGAVVLSRQSTPEHLILISVTIGSVGMAAAAFYRMLAPLAVRDVSLLSQRQSGRARAAMEREKALVLRSIKELEFDRAMGKVSPRDFDEMSARLRARAMMLIKQADEGGAGYRDLIERELSARLVTRSRAGGVQQQAPEPEGIPQAEIFGADEGVGDVPERRSAGDGRHCADCGTGNDVDAAFCKRCGTRLDVVSA